MVKDLKLYVMGDGEPSIVAMWDKNEYLIDCIENHRGDERTKSKMDFLVQWKGYSHEENTWEPYHNLRDTEALDIYCKCAGLKF